MLLGLVQRVGPPIEPAASAVGSCSLFHSEKISSVAIDNRLDSVEPCLSIFVS